MIVIGITTALRKENEFRQLGDWLDLQMRMQTLADHTLHSELDSSLEYVDFWCA